MDLHGLSFCIQIFDVLAILMSALKSSRDLWTNEMAVAMSTALECVKTYFQSKAKLLQSLQARLRLGNLGKILWLKSRELSINLTGK